MAQQLECVSCAPDAKVAAVYVVVLQKLEPRESRMQAEFLGRALREVERWPLCAQCAAHGVQVHKGGYLQQRDISF